MWPYLLLALQFRNEMNIFGPQFFKLQHRDRYNSQTFREVRREKVKRENATGIKVCISWPWCFWKALKSYFFQINLKKSIWRVIFFKCPSAWVRMMFSSAWIELMYFSQKKKNPLKWYVSFVVHHIKGSCCLLILLMMVSTKHSMGYSKITLVEN